MLILNLLSWPREHWADKLVRKVIIVKRGKLARVIQWKLSVYMRQEIAKLWWISLATCWVVKEPKWRGWCRLFYICTMLSVSELKQKLTTKGRGALLNGKNKVCILSNGNDQMVFLYLNGHLVKNIFKNLTTLKSKIFKIKNYNGTISEIFFNCSSRKNKFWIA